MAWKPRQDTLAIVRAARQVLDGAVARGYRFTLRRVFSELVSMNLIPNTERAYKNLSAMLDRARWEDLIEMGLMDDLGRQAVRAQTVHRL